MKEAKIILKLNADQYIALLSRIIRVTQDLNTLNESVRKLVQDIKLVLEPEVK